MKRTQGVAVLESATGNRRLESQRKGWYEMFKCDMGAMRIRPARERINCKRVMNI
jgi:hypothetical protein